MTSEGSAALCVNAFLANYQAQKPGGYARERLPKSDSDSGCLELQGMRQEGTACCRTFILQWGNTCTAANHNAAHAGEQSTHLYQACKAQSNP